MLGQTAERRTRLGANHRLVAAAGGSHAAGFSAIVSTDGDFDGIPRSTRLDPADARLDEMT